MTSLTCLNLGFTGIDSEACEKVCKQLKYLKHLKEIDLSSCPLGSFGVHLVEAIDCWGPHPPLEELHLWNCSMPKKVCAQLLSKLSRCEHLVKLDLSGNISTDCLSNFLPGFHSGLGKLMVLFRGEAQINKDDLHHLTQLIQQSKLPRLQLFSIENNSLCSMENEVERLVAACVTLSFSSERFYLFLTGNNLSSQTSKHLQQLCTGTNIELSL